MRKVGSKWCVMPWEVEGDPEPPNKKLRMEMRHTVRSIAGVLGVPAATYRMYEYPITHERYIIMPVPLARRFLAEMHAFGLRGFTLDDLYHPSIR